ncbi:MAG: hypothetical protein KJ950_06615 [Proteobacteria bacterium]|nr:hypothetical protein [Pseudomonadota bacterium]MBU1687206.1 hypothetical protein [Pseudomonadota bacterium]
MECVNIQRNWAITEDYEITTSTPEGYCTSAHDEYNLNMSQSGCLLTVVAKEGAIFNGKICGTDLSWSGSYTYGDGGTITLNTTTAKTDETGAILVDGNINWTYSDSSGSCNGISSFTGR